MLEVKVDNFQIEISRNHHIGDLNRQLGKLKGGFSPDGNPELQAVYGCFLNVREVFLEQMLSKCVGPFGSPPTC